MKKIKYIILALLVIICVLIFGGILKYNTDLNQFKQDINELPKTKIRSSSSNGSEVHIIGTMHFETDNFKKLDLYKKIDRISPSIILFESDSSTVKRILNDSDYFFQIMRGYQSKKDVEKPVALTYIENNPNCIVLPYEWELRDQFHHKHNLRSKSSEMFNAVVALENEKLLTEDQSIILNKFIALIRALNKIDQDGTLAAINRLATDSLVKQRQYYKYSKLTEIVSERKELSEYLDFAQINSDYWDLRNKAMAQNILKQIQLNPNKVIVVLNGFYHRYYLIDELKKYENEYNFVIKDI